MRQWKESIKIVSEIQKKKKGYGSSLYHPYLAFPDSIQGPSPYKIHDSTSLPKTTVLDQKQEENERIKYKLLSGKQ